MARLHICNAGTEEMMSGAISSRITESLLASALRNAWMAEPGDIYVTACRISPKHTDYIARCMCFPENSVEYTQLTDSSKVLTISDAMLRNLEVKEVLVRHIQGASFDNLNVCYFSTGIAKIFREVGCSDVKALNFALNSGHKLLNRKSIFRAIASGMNVQIPYGRVASSIDVVLETISELLRETGHVIVKADDGSTGAGNYVFSNAPTYSPGVTEVVDLSSSQLSTEMLQRRLGPALHGEVIVEVYHEECRTYYVEFDISERRGSQLEHIGEVHFCPSARDSRAGEYVGLTVPAEIDTQHGQKAVEMGTKLANFALELGYSGKLNVDFILTRSGQLKATEFNGRWGGGTVLYAISTRLSELNDGRQIFLRSWRGERRDDESCRSKLAASAQFENSNFEGVLDLTGQSNNLSLVEYVFVSSSREQLQHLYDAHVYCPKPVESEG